MGVHQMIETIRCYWQSDTMRMNVKMLFTLNSSVRLGLWAHYRNFSVHRSSIDACILCDIFRLTNDENVHKWKIISKRLSSANSNNQLSTKRLHVSIKLSLCVENEVHAHEHNQQSNGMWRSLNMSISMSTYIYIYICVCMWHAKGRRLFVFLSPFTTDPMLWWRMKWEHAPHRN